MASPRTLLPDLEWLDPRPDGPEGPDAAPPVPRPDSAARNGRQAPPRRGAAAPPRPERSPGRAPQRAGPRTRPRRPPWRPALGVASPYLAGGVAAGLAAATGPYLGFGAASVLAPLGVTIGGFLLARELEEAPWVRAWLMALATLATLVPLLGLLTVLADPGGAGNAGGTWMAAGGSGAALLGLAVFAAALEREAPDRAALLFVAPALTVPILLGTGGAAWTAAMRSLAASWVLAGFVVGLAWLLPAGLRALPGPIAFGTLLVALAALGFGPIGADGAGRGIAVPGALVAGLAGVLLVAVPILSLWLAGVGVEVARLQDGGRADRLAQPEGDVPAGRPMTGLPRP